MMLYNIFYAYLQIGFLLNTSLGNYLSNSNTKRGMDTTNRVVIICIDEPVLGSLLKPRMKTSEKNFIPCRRSKIIKEAIFIPSS